MGGYSSHHYNESLGFQRELTRRGKELVLLVSAQAEPRVVEELRARAVLDPDPTFRLEWSFEERSRRFTRMLHKRVDRLVKRDDCVLVTIATQLEAYALTRWLQALPRRKKPFVAVVFLSDRWNRAGRDEYDRQIAEFAEVRDALARVDADDARRLLLYAVTHPLAAELTSLLGTKVEYVPMPMPYSDPPSLPRRDSSRPCVAVLGGTRREKGSYLLPEIIRGCPGADFVVQLTNNTLTAGEATALGVIANEPNVTVIREAMPVKDYEAALAGADLALFPYEVIPYRQRTSGVFAEAVAFGKPVVVAPGTWMAEQLEAGHAAGVVSGDVRAESFARAIARCMDELESLQQRARAKSGAWRKLVSLEAFIDQLETVLPG